MGTGPILASRGMSLFRDTQEIPGMNKRTATRPGRAPSGWTCRDHRAKRKGFSRRRPVKAGRPGSWPQPMRGRRMTRLIPRGRGSMLKTSNKKGFWRIPDFVDSLGVTGEGPGVESRKERGCIRDLGVSPHSSSWLSWPPCPCSPSSSRDAGVPRMRRSPPTGPRRGRGKAAWWRCWSSPSPADRLAGRPKPSWRAWLKNWEAG